MADFISKLSIVEEEADEFLFVHIRNK